jgi:hypothetical protein
VLQNRNAYKGYTSEKGEGMFLDDVCEVQNDPDREARKTLPPLVQDFIKL